MSFALVFIAGVNSAYPQTEPQIEDAKSQVQEMLKDPASVQFKEVAVKKNSLGETAVCGEYNARNSYGGYVGFKTFGVVGKNVSLESAELERMGCMGPEAELARRHP